MTIVAFPMERTLGPDTPVADLPRIKHDYVPKLHKLGIVTVRDLLYHVPRRYEDTREVVTLDRLESGKVQTAQVHVVEVVARTTPRRKMKLLEATLQDATGTAHAVWFNQQFLMSRLKQGRELLVSGKVEWGRNGMEFRSPTFEVARPSLRHVGRIAPVYPETSKLSSAVLRSLIQPVLHVTDALPDRLPREIRHEERLLPIGEALRRLHFPDSEEEIEEARERLGFEELFLLQLAATRARRRRLSDRGAVAPYDIEVARTFVNSLPFKLTDGQRVAAHEILSDLAAPGPMSRLLHGDVGSGKTVVAAMAALMTHQAGMQTAVMAPTEILARQHHATLDALLAPHGLPARLLVGSTSAAARREVLSAIAAGHDSLLVGTHALIEDDVVMENLGLGVVDEQHRFGVAQRQQLRRKAELAPNFLALTATPIPRSLMLTLYGDVDVSELREMPPGRIPVETRVVPPHERPAAYDFVRGQVRAGRQVFVICPIIEDSDRLGVRSATAEFERLQRHVFSELRVELLHGRMAAREKELRMARFSNGEADILVSTSVVEVGVDIPNATVMIIEGAERFGIAQLHQFRGRVGRGAYESHCLLFEGSIDDEGSTRLAAVAGTASGFELAELDLRLRGPGDVVGLRQHGLPDLRVGDLLDLALQERARQAAERWLDHDPSLTEHPPLAEALNGYRAVYDLD
ncbi:MAG TPA: ATP-dependent DNA helicase RecG [Candidatus Dormibacteraeota bacterium]|nr:ATP-dependent DNA helicase RecG [Candidatus Dormibacteraeota bacterium]